MFELSFSFPQKAVENFDLINAALSNLAISNLEIADQDGSLIVRTFADPNKGKDYRYGLKSLVLSCEQENGKDHFHFQFDEAVYPWAEFDPSESYLETWQMNHPDRELCWVQTITYKGAEANVYIVLHHEKPAEA